MRVEFAEGSHSPCPLPHNRFNQGRDFSKHQQGFRLSWSMPLMLVLRDQRVDLTHADVATLYAAEQALRSSIQVVLVSANTIFI